VRPLGVIANRVESIRKLVKKLGPVEQLRFCYEAGPIGYVVYWQLTALGAKCEVVAPTLVPVKSGERVKTDRRDALKLALRIADDTLGTPKSTKSLHPVYGRWVTRPVLDS